MKTEEIRAIIDQARKRQEENAGKFENWKKFWNAFYANLFIVIFSLIGKK